MNAKWKFKTGDHITFEFEDVKGEAVIDEVKNFNDTDEAFYIFKYEGNVWGLQEKHIQAKVRVEEE